MLTIWHLPPANVLERVARSPTCRYPAPRPLGITASEITIKAPDIGTSVSGRPARERSQAAGA
ncbi:MAG: hypothetical protein AAFY28_20340, partial [Actinomycetota bacterium]